MDQSKEDDGMEGSQKIGNYIYHCIVRAQLGPTKEIFDMRR